MSLPAGWHEKYVRKYSGGELAACHSGPLNIHAYVPYHLPQPVQHQTDGSLGALGDGGQLSLTGPDKFSVIWWL